VAAARSGHKAVMTPVSHCYFNVYQGDPATEPESFRGSYHVDMTASWNEASGSIILEMTSEQPSQEIRYTTDGTDPVQETGHGCFVMR